MRRTITVALALVMALCFTLPAMAAQVYVDGQPLDVSTASENGTTLVPLRAIFQSLGAEVNWDGATQTVTAIKGQTAVKLQISSKTAYINGQAVALQVPGKVINDNTMVPLRFVSEALGAEVNWDGTTQTITITSDNGVSSVDGTDAVTTQSEPRVPKETQIINGFTVSKEPKVVMYKPTEETYIKFAISMTYDYYDEQIEETEAILASKFGATIAQECADYIRTKETPEGALNWTRVIGDYEVLKIFSNRGLEYTVIEVSKGV